MMRRWLPGFELLPRSGSENTNGRKLTREPSLRMVKRLQALGDGEWTAAREAAAFNQRHSLCSYGMDEKIRAIEREVLDFVNEVHRAQQSDGNGGGGQPSSREREMEHHCEYQCNVSCVELHGNVEREVRASFGAMRALSPAAL